MNLFQNIFGPRKVILIFVQLSKEGNLLYAVSARVKGSISEAEITQFDTIEEIIKKHGASQAYWIHVSGSGVLSRLVDRSSGYKDDIIINGDKDDFMFSSYTDGEKSVVSFVRKNTLNDSLEKLTKLKAHVLGLSCGSVPFFVLMDEDDSFESEFKISKKKGLISEFSRNEVRNINATFHNEYVTDKQVIAASICAYLYLPKPGFEFCWSEKEMAATRDEYKQHRKFTVLGVTSVLSILLIVSCNYFYINNLNNQVAQLETDLSMSNDNLSLLDRLDQEKTRKEQLIETSGFSGNKFISYYLDKIGQSVPASIYLKNMTIFPVEEKLKEKHKVSVDTKKIEIQGLTGSSIVFDDWIEKMDRLEWVQSVEVLNYTKINESQAEFKLIMLLSR